MPPFLPTNHPTGADAAPSHAVVVGGSLAGLLAAQVLASHFDEVTLVERDRFPSGPAFRKGVPQSRHQHVLWARGLELIEGLMPGIAAELAGAGAVPIGLPHDVLWLNAAGWSRRHPATHQILACSRELLDWTVRARIERAGAVMILPGYEVTGLLADAAAVRGVRLRARPGEDRAADQVELRADLVVDASGRGSRMPRWLAAIGRTPPRETTIDPFLGYASRCYKVPDGFDADWKMLMIQARPPSVPRGGIILPIEGGRWIANVTGAARDYPPTDHDGFLEFARGLRSPLLYETLRDAEPLSPVYGYRRTQNLRRHYDKLRDLPEGLVVLGDAACALNPTYAHGMTVAAREANALDRCLTAQRRRRASRPGDLRGLARRVQREVARSANGAWLIATGEDLRYPTTEGARAGLQVRLGHRYFDRVIGAASADPTVITAFLDVLNLIDEPAALFRPRVMLPVLRGTAGALATPPTAHGRPQRALAATTT